jgi:regulator of protease activity HflC (stomatin/prohibitin superfamily)
MDRILAVVGLAVVVTVIARVFFRKETVYEFERGLLFRKGLLRRTLLPGQHWFLRMHSNIQKVDIRLRTISVPSQEVLSSDNVTIKITLAAQYLVSDPGVAITKVEKFQDAFYMLLQLSLRDLVGGLKIDEVIAKRQEIGKTLFEKTAAKVKDLGLTLKAVDAKDIMFPGDLKKTFAQVVKAQKEGQASLEKARGESAALRNLANAAKMLEGNPTLMQLRVLQSLDAGTGNTMVLGLSPDVMPLPLRRADQRHTTEESQQNPSPLPRAPQTGHSEGDG